ncbi:DSC E3 ubiquitin ligase complex subunit 3 [Neolecta irregularis DAH-3]|uniref:DSC E3 ubiquitin ligase complex subunit 3 n=1 Tax=Neolecta irregularis (strain DAH-3) TaxID=1198029 RepID=A0A1U7LMT3_NEOID|nr:DSC E3 ubiquitin ligase complex subunit 3 [Neolecta irregularis DAH-3]|eukprot:OLL23938.1 DSC E3 ubiquitin ligase complex subunit 3 [Neolecta irregularis DAH-3]
MVNESDPAASTAVTIVVRFTSALPDLTLNFPNSLVPAREIKERINKVHPHTSNRRLRLIYSGRLLPDHGPLNQLIHTDHAFVHCSVGDVLSDVESEETLQVQATTPVPVGFDRFRSAGFSDDDISALRAHFQAVNEDGNIEDEERWIDDNSSDSPEVNYKEMLVGLCVGFFAGLLALVFVWETSLMTKRQRMAVMAGLLVNLSFGVLRVYY